jgi:hypothetical protein
LDPWAKRRISPGERSDVRQIADIFIMRMNRSFIRALLMSVLAGLVLVSAGMASAGHLGALRASTQKVRLETTTCTPEDESDPKKCEDPDQGKEATQPGGGDEVAQPVDPAEREAECNEAAGLTPPEGADGSGTAEEVKTTGLDHAIEVVLANCIKNPKAPGLLNALSHLVANRDRHLAHQAEKDARRAAREAAKAARQSARGNQGEGS